MNAPVARRAAKHPRRGNMFQFSSKAAPFMAVPQKRPKRRLRAEPIPAVVEPTGPAPRVTMSGSDSRLSAFVGHMVVVLVRSLPDDATVRGQLVACDEASIVVRQPLGARVVGTADDGEPATRGRVQNADYRFSRGSVIEIRAAQRQGVSP